MPRILLKTEWFLNSSIRPLRTTDLFQIPFAKMNLPKFLLLLAFYSFAACDNKTRSERLAPGEAIKGTTGSSGGTDTTGIGVGTAPNSPNVPHTKNNANNTALPNIVTGETKKDGEAPK